MLHQQANAVLLDKMVSVFNDKIITQSMVTRLQDTYEARKYLAPQIYNLENKDTKAITEHFIKRLRWKAFFHDHGNDSTEEHQKETFGFKTPKTRNILCNSLSRYS